MKYFYSNGSTLPHIDKFIEGSHIVYVCEVKNYVFNAIRLEEQGWEIRDCIKIMESNSSKQALLLRKPFKGTVADNIIKNGCGGINIDVCRIGNFSNTKPSGMIRWNDFRHGEGKYETEEVVNIKEGRFPANLIISEKEKENLDLQSGITKSSKAKKSDNRVENNNEVFGKGLGVHNPQNSHNDSGGASRFFFSYENEEELDTYLTNLIKVE